MENPLPKRKRTRLNEYDYSTPGAYFVTICTKDRKPLFGPVGADSISARMIKRTFQETIDRYFGIESPIFVVMPNHIHMIIKLESDQYNLNQIIAQYKSGVTRKIREFFPDISVWQRSYHDHIIRNQREYEKIWNYIEGNPLKWNEDCFFIDSAQCR